MAFNLKTVETVTDKHQDMIDAADLLLDNPFLSNLSRADIIHTIIGNIAEFDVEPTVDDIARLTVLSLTWLERLIEQNG
jgi:hypothetical protein